MPMQIRLQQRQIIINDSATGETTGTSTNNSSFDDANDKPTANNNSSVDASTDNSATGNGTI